MSEFKGTPGPWRVDETVALGAYGVWTDVADRLEENPIQVCRFNVRDTIPTQEERGANARLIAAAPDLLAACQRALGTCYNKNSEDGQMLSSAIAKALGHFSPQSSRITP